ncbi:MAG: flagellar filament capping protein FliD [Candidatus Puniceispirillum sp.]
MAVDYLSALNVGSGLNTTELIDTLVTAERAPTESLITKGKEERTVNISSVGRIKQGYSDFNTALAPLDGITGLTASHVGSSLDIEITDNTIAKNFSSNIEISKLASGQNLVFDGFSSASSSVGTGTLAISLGKRESLSVTETTNGGSSNVEVQSIGGLDNTAITALAGQTLTLSDGTNTVSHTFSPGSLTITETTAGTSSVAEIQSITGLDSTGLANLAGQTLTLSDGTNSITHTFDSAPADLNAMVTSLTNATGYADLDFGITAGTDALTLTYEAAGVKSLATANTSSPANLASIVTAIQGATGYSALAFGVSAGTNALTLTYESNGAVGLATAESFDPNDDVTTQNITIGTQTAFTVSETTAGSGSVAEIQSVAGFASSDLTNLAGQTVTISDGTNSIEHTFTTAPANLAAVVSALQGATGYNALNFGITAGSDALTLTYESNGAQDMATAVKIGGGDSLTEVRDYINASSLDITASIVKKSDTNYALAIKSREGLDYGMNIAVTETPASSGLSSLSYTKLNSSQQTVAAEDASMTVDGIAVTRNSNKVTDLIDGMTITLKSTTTSPESIGASYDSDTAYAAMSLFITNINTLAANLDAESKRGINGAENGPLAGDPSIRSLRQKLRSFSTQAIAGFDDNPIYLASFGVRTELDGTLTLDETQMKAAFDANPDSFAAIMNSRVTTGSPLVKGSVSGDNYTPGSYSFTMNGSVGTLDSTEMTNFGTAYASTSGATNGVALSISGGGANTTVYVGKSLLETFQEYAGKLLESNNELDKKIEVYNNEIEDYDAQLAALDTRMASLRSQYVTKFSAMNSAVASMESTKTQLTSMMDAWTASLKA